MIGHAFVICDNDRRFPLSYFANLARIDEMKQYYIHLWVRQKSLANDPLHATDLFDIREAIGVIIHSRLLEEQIDRPFRQNIALESKGTWRRTERGNTGS